MREISLKPHKAKLEKNGSMPNSRLPDLIKAGDSSQNSLLKRRRRKLNTLKIDTTNLSQASKSNPSLLIRDMKNQYSKTSSPEPKSAAPKNCGNEIEYLFVKPRSCSDSITEGSISQFLNKEGIFQISLPQAFELQIIL
ncbi:unnamed protein product [Moneuplotes crassus]|uniref:Uncharacterized protein n=1 Tax=Euplotes crassus TaxID=5936 RepID=A0AAD1Y606_EUPCR|nr:unnamed protein product [Moneuplotes crassus]